MADKRAKILGIAIIVTAFLIASFSSLSVTGLSILDTDASTYIIVVMLMLFVFMIFAAKEDINFEYSKRNIAYSVLIFLFYVLLLSYLRVAFSFAFLSYRIDALLFPLPLLAFIVMVFGTSGAKKLTPLIVYAAFASPLILLPILNLNGAFANLNARIIYDFINAVGVPVSRAGLVISTSLGSNITISTTCVSIGTFVAFVMFLIPLAYLYEGRLRSKLYWMVSGILLILLLNLIRMLSISLVWAFYGLNSAINTFHAFAGQLIFYIAIVLMVLFAYKYGLSVKSVKKGTAKHIKSFYKFKDDDILVPVIFIFVLAAIALFLNSGYVNAVYAPALFFNKNSNISTGLLNQQILGSIENSDSAVLVLGTGPQGDLFLLGSNSPNADNSVYVITNFSYTPIPTRNLVGYQPLGRPSSYLLKNGVTITSQEAYSGNETFMVNYFSAPYNLSGSWVTVNYLMFDNASAPQSNCNLMGNEPDQYHIESYIYNILNMQSPVPIGIMCQSYLIASSYK